MTQKSPRFVSDFATQFMGRTLDEFASNLSGLMAQATEFHRMCDTDIGFALDLVRTHDCQETRRILIRTLPPYVEGALNVLKIVVNLCPPLQARIPPDAAAHFLAPLVSFRSRTTIKDDIRTTFQSVGLVVEQPFREDIMGESGAQALLRSFALRDSLMHPFSIDGFIVGDDQLALAHTGHLWFVQKEAFLFSALIRRIEEVT